MSCYIVIDVIIGYDIPNIKCDGGKETAATFVSVIHILISPSHQ